MHQSLLLFGALLLVALNAFFVLAEFAIVKVRATRVEELVRRGSLAAGWTSHVVKHLDAHLSATQLGITMTSLGLGWIGEPALASLLEPLFRQAGRLSPVLAHSVAVSTGFLAITFLHVVFGELAPKSIAIRKPEWSALVSSGPLRAFYYVFFPLIWVFNTSANLALAMVGFSPAGSEEVAHSEEELRMILLRSTQVGSLEHVRADLLENLLDFSRLTARQMMVPRTDVVYLTLDRPAGVNLERARESGHTRFPVCHGGLDQVVGIVHVKDLFGQRDGEAGPDLTAVMREAVFVPETMPADRLLRTFQRKRQHLAIVVDEYGGASGVVTLEDVIEEIVGEVQDEFDQEPPAVVTAGDGVLIIDGRARIEDVLDRLGARVEDLPDVDTLGGYIQAALGRLARPGDRAPLGDYELRVIDAGRARVRRVEARRKSVAAPAETPPGALSGTGE